MMLLVLTKEQKQRWPQTITYADGRRYNVNKERGECLTDIAFQSRFLTLEYIEHSSKPDDHGYVNGYNFARLVYEVDGSTLMEAQKHQEMKGLAEKLNVIFENMVDFILLK